ncbi:hypothetical protein E4U42_000319 [Claviceps africana]|uniref:Cystathionine gamma-synthase n=1 Tax=Claviceps africana TaxID=83212 RepID=A0A8K0NNB0_9HYPO|nr:hypothetical protein E4U42_000319 [Claviceps africana]
MGILRTQSEFGHAPPPQTPYSIVTNLPGWDMLKALRDGDRSPLASIVHIYPRFAPTLYARALSQEIAKQVGLAEWSCFMYLDPIMWKYTEGHVSHEQRREYAISPHKLTFKVVDVAGHRLYCVLFEPQHAMALKYSWGTPGLGLSVRESEYLLGRIDTLVQVPFESKRNPPAPTWTPEGPAHESLRKRIIELLQHGAIDPQLVQSQPQDVYLYPSGMAAIFEATNVLREDHPNKTFVELGMVFHNTHELLQEEFSQGWRHFGRIDDKELDHFEMWLEEEAIRSGGGVAFAIVEIPMNPTLESPNLPRLKKLSEMHNFVLIVDDTVGSFANLDVLSQTDVLLTSLTKSFSGRSDVMGGSIVLNPLSPHYAHLSRRLAETHHNQLFAADAQVLVSNSHDFFERSERLSVNAQAMAEFLHKSMTEQPDSPVVSVQYPSLLASKVHYDALKRRSTPELPTPGYGCLLTVEFESVQTTRAFYDRCGFYPSPHLGGHVTIMFAYNMFVFGRDKEQAERLADYGIREESVRISAGLEETRDLLDTLQDALDAAMEVKRGGR